MARIDLVRVGQRLARELHRELIAYPLGPLAEEVQDDQDYQLLTLPIALRADGAPKDLILLGAHALAEAIREVKPKALARMVMPEEQSGLDGVRVDEEKWQLSVRVLFIPADPIFPFGKLELTVVGVPFTERVH